MKNILTLILFLPLYMFAQTEDGTFILGVNLGIVQDVEYTDLDENQYSPDMSSTFGDSDKAFQVSAGYKMSKITIGAHYKRGNINGKNDIEYHETSFNERSLFIEYDLIQRNSLILFVSGSYGEIAYDSKRYLVFDDTEIPINSPDGQSSKLGFGFGLKVLLGENFILSIQTSRDTVEDDGFDGWDYGTEKDKFSYHSIGLSFLL